MEETGGEIICGAPTALAVKGLMMMMMMMMMSWKKLVWYFKVKVIARAHIIKI